MNLSRCSVKHTINWETKSQMTIVHLPLLLTKCRLADFHQRHLKEMVHRFIQRVKYCWRRMIHCQIFQRSLKNLVSWARQMMQEWKRLISISTSTTTKAARLTSIISKSNKILIKWILCHWTFMYSSTNQKENTAQSASVAKSSQHKPTRKTIQIHKEQSSVTWHRMK